MTKQGIVDTIKESRKQSGLSQKQLADAAKTYKNEVSRIEAGKKTFTVDTMLKLFEALNITITLD